MGQGPRIDFLRPPRLGTVVSYRSRIILTLIRTVPFRRQDGGEEWLLEWSASNGRTCVSGLRSRGVIWTTAEEHLKALETARTRRAAEADELGA